MGKWRECPRSGLPPSYWLINPLIGQQPILGVFPSNWLLTSLIGYLWFVKHIWNYLRIWGAVDLVYFKMSTIRFQFSPWVCGGPRTSLRMSMAPTTPASPLPTSTLRTASQPGGLWSWLTGQKGTLPTLKSYFCCSEEPVECTPSTQRWPTGRLQNRGQTWLSATSQ